MPNGIIVLLLLPQSLGLVDANIDGPRETGQLTIVRLAPIARLISARRRWPIVGGFRRPDFLFGLRVIGHAF
jgi:hypothetical protein